MKNEDVQDAGRRARLTRRGFLATAGAAVAGAALAPAMGTVHAASRKPNVVFFLVDDMGWVDSTVYGSRYYETPNLERLARRSMRFTNAYSAAPLCTATRASIMTGKYPGRLHITGAGGHLPDPEGPLLPESGPPHMRVLQPRAKGALPLEEYTLGEAFRDAGYRTGFFGKWHLGHDPRYWPEHQGFDVNIGGGRWPGPPSYFSPYRISKLPDGPEGEYIADRLTDEAIAFIEESKDGPFYLNMWQYAVHAPYQGKPEYIAYFEGKKDPRGAQDNAVMGAMIKSMDESLGRILDTLEQLDLMDDTIIIFTSDNGGNMYDRTLRDGTNAGAWAPEGRTPTNNAPLRSGKGSVYEGGVRVPALVYWPGRVETEQVSHEVISSVDYYPTLLEMTGIAPRPEQQFDGTSIVPALLGGALDRETVYCHFPHNPDAVPVQMASWVRRGDHKLIRFYDQDENFPNRLELYDLRLDIGEMNNLAEQEPELARELEAMLDAHLLATGALVPKPNPAYQADAAREVNGWVAGGDCYLTKGDGALRMHCTGGDPQIIAQRAPEVAGPLTARMRLRSQSGGPGHFFWRTRGLPRFGPVQRLDFQAAHDGAWEEIEVAFEAASELLSLRIDPSNAPGLVEFAWIRLSDASGTVLQAWEF